MPNEENKLTGGAWSRVMRAQVVAVAVVGTAVGAFSPLDVHAEFVAQRSAVTETQMRRRNMPVRPRTRGNPAAHSATSPALHAVVPADLDQRRRDGHMTPEERRLLRQHIEDAGRDLYKR